ncbi:MAG: outer membrane protein assembly factor BamC [Gallionellaceae bacterium]|jgi:outer membrane protein assembly factor BamC|nr:outer membrane protein assembly factor BamC [Gallionellaceae bacterium]
MRTLTPLACALALVTLAGCGSMALENKKVDYGGKSARAASLEVPPDLTTPAAGDHYTLPEDDEAANYSDFVKGDDAAPEAATGPAVLPKSPKVRMERDGAKRWLVVEDTAENVWPQVKAFFTDNGLQIKTDNPQAGVIETDWAENRASIPKGGLRTLLGKFADNLYESGTRDMYRARLERVNDGAGTEIYLSHTGLEDGDKGWQSRPNDPELEAAMLQMLAVKLGGSEGTEVGEDGVTTTIAMQDDGSVAPPEMLTQGDSPYIKMNEPFDKSWRKVGLAIERLKYTVTDKNRLAGLYYVRIDPPAKEKGMLDKLKFWKGDDAPKGVRYQIQVRELGNYCEVSAHPSEVNENIGELTQDITKNLFTTLGGK